MEDTGIVATKVLVVWYDSLQRVIVHGQRSNRGQQPTVSYMGIQARNILIF